MKNYRFKHLVTKPNEAEIEDLLSESLEVLSFTTENLLLNYLRTI